MATTLANLKKGDTVILHMFTGIAVGVKEILAADKNTVTLETRIGKAKFSRKTGKQVEPEAKAEKYANFITEDDGSYVPPERKDSKKKAKKEAEKAADKKADKKKSKVEEVPDDEEEKKPSKKSDKKADKKAEKQPDKKKKPSKKDEDDDEYEEVE
jgi:hypothetical protein